MSKHQTGLRIDRLLFQQFQEMCSSEKLRPGEAVEMLIQLAIRAGRVNGLDVDRKNSARMADDALFRSRLARLRTCLVLEERHLKESGREMEDKESEDHVESLAELARRGVSTELVKEFETYLSDSDKLYEETMKSIIEQQISETRSREAVRELIRSSE